MNKKKSLILVLLMVLCLVCTSCMLVACNAAADEEKEKETDPVEIEATEGLLIKNSDFKVTSSTTDYPSTATDWTGAKLYSSGSYADAVISGVINLTKETYDKDKADWNDNDDTLYNKLIQDNHFGTEDEIKNALLIYMPEKNPDAKTGDPNYGPTAYGYTSSSFSLDKASYYKFSVDVLTSNIAGDTSKNTVEPGARIYVSSNTYAEFSKIDTQGAWKTYSIFIESAPTAATSLTVNLSLGKYTSSYTYGLTTGYAVFDNITLEKVDKAAYEQAIADEKEDNSTIQTNTLTVPNGRFDFGTTTLGSTSAPSNWSVVTGNSTEDDAAPTSKGYNAIIDASKFADNYKNYSSTFYLKNDSETEAKGVVFADTLLKDTTLHTNIKDFKEGTIGNNIYMLSQQLMTAQGLKSSKAITIEKNKKYAISINLYTFGIHGAGVSLVLSGKDTKDIVIKGISENKADITLIGNVQIDPANKSYILSENIAGATTGQWETYVFYITGNQFYDYSYNLTVWLGTDGTSLNKEVEYTKYSSTSESTDKTYTANGTFSNGWVFIDEAKCNVIAEIPAIGVEEIKVDLTQTKAELDVFDTAITAIAVDLSQKGDPLLKYGNLLDTSNVTSTPTLEGNTLTNFGVPTNWARAYIDTTNNTNPIVNGLITEGLVDITSQEKFDQSFASGSTTITYPSVPYERENTYAFMLNAKEDTAYGVRTNNIEVKNNSTYRLSFWIKTVGLKETAGAYISLMNANGTKGDGSDDTSLSTVDLINTQNYEKDTNEWQEITFYICGSDKETNNVYIKLALGKGTRWSASTLTTGSLYFANFNLAPISYKAFGDISTGTYVKSVDLSSSYTYTFTNGSFDSYDKDDDKIDTTKALFEQEVTGQPNSWTFSDDKQLDNDKLIAGVIELIENDEYPYNSYPGLYYKGSHQTDTLLPSISFTDIYGDITNDTEYLNSNHFSEIAGPYILALSSSDPDAIDANKKYSIGYTSSSFSLSANTIYKVSVYARIYGDNTTASIFLTGESSGNALDNYFTIATTNNKWLKYTYYIQVGQSSVSPKLNLWLGTNKDYVTEDQFVGAQGTVLFDNVTLTTIDEEEYNKAEVNDTTKKLSFTIDGFDSLSSSASAKKELTSANGWSGAVDTNQSSSNTKSGVIYMDPNFLPDEDSDGYFDILGKSYKLDDYKISDEELQEAKGKPEYDGMDDDKIILALKEEKLAKDKETNLLTSTDLLLNGEKNMSALVINNIEKSAYIYTSSSMTLKANSFYKISINVRTLKLNDSEKAGAYIRLYLGNAEEDEPLMFGPINTNGAWEEYTFLVETFEESVSSVTIKLALGRYIDSEEDEIPTLTSGYAFFDDVAVEIVDSEEYTTAVEGDKLAKHEVKISEEGKADEDPEEPGDITTPKFNLEYLWWMIPTIILGLLIIIVVIVWVIKTVKKKHPAKKAAESSDDNTTSTQSIEEIRSKYDSNKE